MVFNFWKYLKPKIREIFCFKKNFGPKLNGFCKNRELANIGFHYLRMSMWFKVDLELIYVRPNFYVFPLVRIVVVQESSS